MKTSLIRSLAMLTVLSACFGESPVPTGPASAISRFGKTASLSTVVSNQFGDFGVLYGHGGTITLEYLGGAGQFPTTVVDDVYGTQVATGQVTASGTIVTLAPHAAGEEVILRFTVPDGDGRTYYSGSAGRNPDGHYHVSVSSAGNGCYILGFEETFAIQGQFDDMLFKACLGDDANRPPVADAGDDQVGECNGYMIGSVTLNASRSTDPDGDALNYTWKDWNGNVIGTGVSITVSCKRGDAFRLTVDDGRGGDSEDVVGATFVDTTPPVFTGMSASTTVLEPANHKMVRVSVTASATDLCTAGFVDCRITSVTSNEVDDGDIEVTDRFTVNLRAERNGNGNGRIYTITVTCTDAFNNPAVKTVTVTVPKGKN